MKQRAARMLLALLLCCALPMGALTESAAPAEDTAIGDAVPTDAPEIGDDAAADGEAIGDAPMFEVPGINFAKGAETSLNAAMPEITPPPLRSTLISEILPENAALLPSDSSIQLQTKLYHGETRVDTCDAEESIVFYGSDTYTELEGITTFRGTNFRDTSSYGTIPTNPSKLSVVYSRKISGIDSWSGVGWTGQASAVRWPDEVRSIMNIYDEKKAKQGLIEVIYATLDGHIYFFDLEDGEPTRDPINIGAPIKGSLTIDPRGYPLMYCGQGIAEVKGKSVEIGMRVFSLIDSSVLLFINGRDSCATRRWYASDCSPLVNAETDTLLWAGENGLFYRVKLNTNYDPAAGTIAIDPVIDRYWYGSKVTTRPGMECSFSAYNHYVFLPDNSGLLQCLDIDTFQPIWAFDLLDDTDSSPVLEVDDEGQLWLYTGSEFDLAKREYCYLRRINAFTGAEDWCIELPCSNTHRGGTFATPAMGKGDVSDLIFYVESMTKEGSFLLAIEKDTGEIRWHYDLGKYSWSSPMLCMDENEKAYLVECNSGGLVRLFDAATGKVITSCEVDGNVEGSPIAFDDMIVFGTRACKIYGIRIQ